MTDAMTPERLRAEAEAYLKTALAWLAEVPDGAVFVLPGSGGLHEGAIVSTREDIAHATRLITILLAHLSSLSEVESGSEGVTDADAIERGAAALFKHAGLSLQDDGSFAYVALGEIGKERYRKAVRSVVEAAIGSRLAAAAKAEARVKELERALAASESIVGLQDGVDALRYATTPSPERAEEGGK